MAAREKSAEDNYFSLACQHPSPSNLGGLNPPASRLTLILPFFFSSGGFLAVCWDRCSLSNTWKSKHLSAMFNGSNLHKTTVSARAHEQTSITHVQKQIFVDFCLKSAKVLRSSVHLQLFGKGSCFKIVKPHSNGRNIVSQHFLTLLANIVPTLLPNNF